MGNCQAAEAAAVVVQHPGGRVERLYWPTSAAEVMRTNPGHYVALVILRVSPPPDKPAAAGEAAPAGGARITRVKLLKPKDTLLLGQVYRLITSQEVTKALRARKYEKMKRCELSKLGRDGHGGAGEEREPSSHHTSEQEAGRENDRRRSCGDPPPASGGVGGGRARQWRPSLQSISESAG